MHFGIHRYFLPMLCVLFGAQAFALNIPRQLSASDRTEVIRLLGNNTSTKLLTNPFPLGGYNGFEVGISIEVIDIRDLSKLGCTPGAPGCPNTGLDTDHELRYPRITIGKGLYNNLDLFIHFSPQTSASELVSFGGAARYSFYEAKFLPINLSILFSADHANYNDDFTCLTYGEELVGGIYVENFSLYFGTGLLHSTGKFIAGTGEDATVSPSDPAVGSNTQTVTQKLTLPHTFIGLSIHFDELFIAAQVDRYPDTVYSTRLGVRF